MLSGETVENWRKSAGVGPAQQLQSNSTFITEIVGLWK